LFHTLIILIDIRFHYSNAFNIKDWTGTIGVPIPGTEATILDEQGSPVALGEVGEICVRGPHVMQG
jgi:long-chain acyl-CoA synthetase